MSRSNVAASSSAELDFELDGNDSEIGTHYGPLQHGQQRVIVELPVEGSRGVEIWMLANKKTWMLANLIDGDEQSMSVNDPSCSTTQLNVYLSITDKRSLLIDDTTLEMFGYSPELFESRICSRENLRNLAQMSHKNADNCEDLIEILNRQREIAQYGGTQSQQTALGTVVCKRTAELRNNVRPRAKRPHDNDKGASEDAAAARRSIGKRRRSVAQPGEMVEGDRVEVRVDFDARAKANKYGDEFCLAHIVELRDQEILVEYCHWKTNDDTNSLLKEIVPADSVHKAPPVDATPPSFLGALKPGDWLMLKHEDDEDGWRPVTFVSSSGEGNSALFSVKFKDEKPCESKKPAELRPFWYRDPTLQEFGILQRAHYDSALAAAPAPAAAPASSLAGRIEQKLRLHESAVKEAQMEVDCASQAVERADNTQKTARRECEGAEKEVEMAQRAWRMAEDARAAASSSLEAVRIALKSHIQEGNWVAVQNAAQKAGPLQEAVDNASILIKLKGIEETAAILKRTTAKSLEAEKLYNDAELLLCTQKIELDHAKERQQALEDKNQRWQALEQELEERRQVLEDNVCELEKLL